MAKEKIPAASGPAKPGKSYLRTNGSLFGKFAPVLVYDDAVEVRTISTAALVLVLWASALVIFFLTSLIDMFLGSILTLVGGLVAFFLTIKYYRGKLDRRMEFKDMVSFVRDGPEFTFNTKDNYMYSVRMSAKKQDQLLENLAIKFRENPDYTLVRMGDYLKVYPREKEEAQPAVPPASRKKGNKLSKKAPSDKAPAESLPESGQPSASAGQPPAGAGEDSPGN